MSSPFFVLFAIFEFFVIGLLRLYRTCTTHPMDLGPISTAIHAYPSLIVGDKARPAQASSYFAPATCFTLSTGE